MSWGRICMLLILLDSWAFLFTGMFACAVLHNVDRLLIHAFLVEKVYIVWSNGCMIPRRKTNMYKVCLLVQMGFMGLFLWFFPNISTRIGEKGACFVVYEGNLFEEDSKEDSYATTLFILITSDQHKFDSDYMAFLSVCLNAIILHWVSSEAPSDSLKDFTLPQITTTIEDHWEVDLLGNDIHRER
ncbi:hypothetical protein L218DRAFT_948274 [Marasmius fiardii PR-910]|nr:hypothetical protein L218DRAFT_948274 [Marasmius fiardii PR-910]